jgi:hypothetical protein
MAKSKLSNQLNHALIDVEVTLGRLQETFKGRKLPDGKDRTILINQIMALDNASQAMSDHLDKLKTRETSPTVPQKLRNLKNFFKSTEDLKKQRADTRQWYVNFRQRINGLREESNKMLHGEDSAQAEARLAMVHAELAEIKRMQLEVNNFDRKVEAIEAALM